MGDVDLVCQVESPGNVARGLQRVGRAGHVVHGVSKGRLIAKTPADLLETAALARAMLQGNIERSARSARLPRRPGPAGGGLRGDGPLERARPLRHGARRLSVCRSSRRGLRARALPGLGPLSHRSRSATCGPGSPGTASTIAWRRCRARRDWPWSAAERFPTPASIRCFWARKARGWASLTKSSSSSAGSEKASRLGNNTWRIEAIDTHMVVVSPAEGNTAVMPFWRGEDSPRSAELGEAVGRALP